MDKRERVLITGGCGFVGTNLIYYLLEKTDWDLSVLDNLTSGKVKYLESIKNYSEERIELTRGDIRDREDIRKAMDGCDSVIHLAAQTGVIPSIDDPFEDAEVNIMGTINLLEGSVEKGIERFTLASSAAPLGEQEMPLHEEKVPHPLAPYGASKLACEGYVSAYAGSHGLETAALRFSNVYGPNSWHKGSVVAKFIKQIIDGEQQVIYGDGEQTRDFIHTSDISQALYLSTVSDSVRGGDLFQIATGRETTINGLYQMIKEELEEQGVEVPEVKHGEERAGEIYRNYADISKAREVLGYDPEVELKDGIEETVSWFLKNY